MKLQILITLFYFISIGQVLPQSLSKKKIEKIKIEALSIVESNFKNTQVMIDKVFSFAELGFQEVETSKYLTKILNENDFEIEYGVSDIPTAWFAKWSNGEGPVIALGSDVD